MTFVLDASVALAWVFEDEARPETDALLDRLRTERAIVPPIWMTEVANALTVAQRRGRLTEAQAFALAEILRQLPIDPADGSSMSVLLAGGTRHGLSAYDAAYLDLAERRGVPLAALDGRLRGAAVAAGVDVLPA